MRSKKSNFHQVVHILFGNYHVRCDEHKRRSITILLIGIISGHVPARRVVPLTWRHRTVPFYQNIILLVVSHDWPYTRLMSNFTLPTPHNTVVCESFFFFIIRIPLFRIQRSTLKCTIKRTSISKSFNPYNTMRLRITLK